MRSLLLLIQLCLCATSSVGAQNDSSGQVAIAGVTVVDVQTGRLLPDHTVLVEDRRIAAVAPRADVRLPAAARVIDGTGKYLIPGLIDTHAHLFGPWRRNWPDSIAQFGWIMSSGVTTMRDAAAGGLEPNYLALRAAADSGRILAPRLRLSGFIGDSDAGVDAALATLVRSGLDGVKLREAPRGEALEIIRAARSVGVPVYGHTDWAPTDTTRESYTLSAVEAGISGVMHIYAAFEPDGTVATNTGPPVTYQSSREEIASAQLHELSAWLDVDEEWQQRLIDAMVSRGTWLEPTLTVQYHGSPLFLGRCTRQYDLATVQRYYTYRSSSGPAGLTSAQTDTLQRICGAIATFVRRFYEAGGMVIAGSDYIPFAPLGVPEEIRLLVEAGLPPLAGLQAATINAARALEMEDDIGTIERGKLADLVLLEGNPLEDIENVGRIASVIADGRVLDRDALLARTGTTPPMVSRDDRLEVIDDQVRQIAFEHPDSVIEVSIETDGSFSEADVRQIQNLMRAGSSTVDGSVVRVRGRALGTRFISRIRFVTRISLAAR